MITRIFRVQIKPHLRQEFEEKFATVSVQAVDSKEGFCDVAIGRPTRWDPDEYVMISRWENEQALVQFAGSDWHQAIIPAGMEKFVESCSVHHYEAW